MGVLVTGSTGFVGRCVLEHWSDSVVWPRIHDLTDHQAVRDGVGGLASEFDAVLHLAAQSDPHLSVSCPVETWNVNLMGTVHLLEALSEREWRGRFLFASSGAVYGRIKGEVNEHSPVLPGSPYVASKLAAENAVIEWGQRTGNHVIVARPFNHSGPGQSTSFFLPAIVEQIVSLPSSGGEVEVGNLDVQRDFSHVLDIVRGYRHLLEKGKAGEIYNLASGRSVRLSDVLQDVARLGGRRVTTKTSSERFRPEAQGPVCVSLDKVKRDTGWAPRLSLEELLKELVSEWTEKTCQNQR